jgi:DNA mismatch repair protein MutL
MGSIRLLDEHIANQIAAGEVVERPSSVVKELVENAVDAGGTRIDVMVEEGGLTLIRVTDNGSGMETDDCEIAFQRHATSKITTGKDLFAIRTLGFRGEALPSIAAVSKLECVTSHTSDGSGRRIVIEGGAVRSLEDAAYVRGTEITVRQLFYNTPARLKYMKTIQTELGHISDYMYRLALAHPQIAFSLKHNGNFLLQTAGSSDIRQVVATIYGTATGKAMLQIQGEDLDFKINGYMSKPELTRANRSAITTIINGRYVRNFALNAALLLGYHTLLPINRFPVAVLHITMDPTLIDVNVHPAKLEVRFSKEAELTQLLEKLVKQTLGTEVLIPKAPLSSKLAFVQEQMTLYRLQSQQETRDLASKPSGQTFSSSSQSARTGAGSPRTDWSSLSSSASSESWRETAASGTSSYPSVNLQQRSGQGRIGKSDSKIDARTVEPFMEWVTQQSGESAVLPSFPKLNPIGQLHGTYLIAQNDSGLYLIDQHAAHERINYEYYYDKFGNPEQASQQLLVPITLDFTSAEAALILEKLPLLEQIGVEMEAFGGSSFIVRSHPHWFPLGDERSILEELCEWILSERKGVDLAKLREKSSIMCSCKASIKANQSLTLQEMEALIDRLADCGNPYTCPHGRPIVVSFSTYELEKMFKRVM